MAKKMDLNNLRKEIDIRKQEKNVISSKLGEAVGSNVTPKDVFLNGLLTSLTTGKPTPSTNLIKIVENKALESKGQKATFNVNTEQPLQPNQTLHNLPTTEVMESPEREDKFYNDFDGLRKKTLAESMKPYIQNVQETKTHTPQLNEGYLVESVKKVVNNYLAENFTVIVEEAIKSTILEMYAVERIKEVLQENKELVKSLVYETIRELQAKKKAQ